MPEISERGRAALIILLIGLAITGVVFARLRPDETLRIARFLLSLDRSAGQGGWIVIALAEIGASLCGIVPASLIAIAAGMIYGTISGFVVCAPAVLLGAFVGFRLSRSVFRERIAGLIGRDRRLRTLDSVVAREGWRLVFLFRLSPIMPFALMSYAFGLTSLDLGSYLVGTCASLPPLLLYTGLGSFARRGVETVSADSNLLHLAVPAISLGATVLLFGHLTRLVSRTLKQTAEGFND